MRPKKTKHRKAFKGRNRGIAFSCEKIEHGSYALRSVARSRLSEFTLEAARKVLSKHIKKTKSGKFWTRIFPFLPVTKKPADVRMGGGKGSVEFYASRIKPGTIIFEVCGVEFDIARDALLRATRKLGIKCRIERNLIGGLEDLS